MCSDCGKLSVESNDDLLSNLLSSVDRSLRLLFANFCFYIPDFFVAFLVYTFIQTFSPEFYCAYGMHTVDKAHAGPNLDY